MCKKWHNKGAKPKVNSQGGTWPIFWYRWAPEGLKPWPTQFRTKKNPKTHTMFYSTTTSILSPCLEQRTKFMPSCFRAIQGLRILLMSGVTVTSASQVLESFWNIWSQVSQRKKAIFRLSSTWSWHVYTIVRDTRSSCGGPLTWKAQIHDGLWS